MAIPLFLAMIAIWLLPDISRINAKQRRKIFIIPRFFDDCQAHRFRDVALVITTATVNIVDTAIDCFR